MAEFSPEEVRLLNILHTFAPSPGETLSLQSILQAIPDLFTNGYEAATKLTQKGYVVSTADGIALSKSGRSLELPMQPPEHH